MDESNGRTFLEMEKTYRATPGGPQGVPKRLAADWLAVHALVSMTIIARVHNGRIVLPDGAQVAEGTEVQVILPESATPGFDEGPLACLSEFVGILDTLPADAAERHTELAHGRKRHLD